MKSRTRKLVHAAAITGAGVVIEIGQQLASGQLNLARAALFGVGVGAVARVVGALLAAGWLDDPADAGPPA